MGSGYLSVVQNALTTESLTGACQLKIRPGHLIDWLSANWHRRHLPLGELATLSTGFLRIGQLSEVIPT